MADEEQKVVLEEEEGWVQEEQEPEQAVLPGYEQSCAQMKAPKEKEELLDGVEWTVPVLLSSAFSPAVI